MKRSCRLRGKGYSLDSPYPDNHSNTVTVSGTKVPESKGNPVRIRDCPAAVKENDRHHTHWAIVSWEAMASRNYSFRFQFRREEKGSKVRRPAVSIRAWRMDEMIRGFHPSGRPRGPSGSLFHSDEKRKKTRRRCGKASYPGKIDRLPARCERLDSSSWFIVFSPLGYGHSSKIDEKPSCIPQGLGRRTECGQYGT